MTPDPAKAFFLDIDGVLNTRKTWGAWIRLGRPSSLEPVLVDRARRIQAATGAVVVLSSSWRLEQCAGLAKTLLCLEERGWPNARDVFHREVTPHVGGPRGKEIAIFLEEHPEIKTCVVIDDDPDVRDVEAHWLPVDIDFGIQEDHIDEAIKRLGLRTPIP